MEPVDNAADTSTVQAQAVPEEAPQTPQAAQPQASQPGEPQQQPEPQQPQQPSPQEQPTKPASSASYEDLIGMYHSGALSNDDFQNAMLRKMATDDFYSMKPDHVEAALDRGIIKEDDVERWAERQLHPIRFYAKDFGQGIWRGAFKGADAFNEVVNKYTPVQYLYKFPTDSAERWRATETILGGLAEGLSQYGVVALATGPAASGVTGVAKSATTLGPLIEQYPKAAAFLEHVAHGAATDFLAFDPFKDGKLADLIYEKGKFQVGSTTIDLSTAVPEYLKTDPQGSVAEERLKQALEGFYAGVAVDGLLKVVTGLKVAKNKLWARNHGDAGRVSEAVDAAIGDHGPTGSLAAQFESAGNSGIIGWDTKGGTSYGKYQIAAKPGTMEAFLKFADEKAPDIAKALREAGPAETGGRHGAMPEAWAALARDGKIQTLEEEFIRKTHYDVAHGLLDPDVKNLVDGTKGMQEILFSHSLSGPAYAKDFNKAYEETIAKGGSLESFIDKTYDLRLSHFTGENYNLVKERFTTTERNEAKRLVLGDGFGPAPGTMPHVEGEGSAEGSIQEPAGGPSFGNKLPKRNEAEAVSHGEDILSILERHEQSIDESLHQGPAPGSFSAIEHIEKYEGTTEDLLRSIHDASRDELAMAKRLGMTIPEMQAQGDKYLKTIKDISGARDFANAAFERSKANTAALAATSKLIATFKHEIETKALRMDTMPVEELVKLNQDIGLMGELYTSYEGMRSEASKSMNTLRGPINQRFDLSSAAKDLGTLDPDLLRRNVKMWMAAKDDVTKARVASQFGDYGWLRRGLEYVQANMLWRAGTHITNIMGNAVALAIDDCFIRYGAMAYQGYKSGDMSYLKQAIIETEALGTGLIKAFQLPGAFSKLFKGDYKEFLAGLKGNEELGTVWRALWSGDAVTDAYIKLEGTKSFKTWANGLTAPLGFKMPLGTILTLPFNGLTAGDELFSTLITHKRVAGGLFREGYESGLRGKNLDAYLTAFSKNPPEAILKDALEAKRRLTFTQTSELPFIKAMDKVGNTVPGLLGRIAFMPFWKITANMMEFAYEHSPFAVFGKNFKEAIEAGGVRRYEAVGKVTAGVATMAAGFAMSHYLGYRSSTPQSQEQAYNMTGVPENAVPTLGGKWSDWPNKLGPFSMLLNFGAGMDRLFTVSAAALEDYNDPKSDTNKAINSVFAAFTGLLFDPLTQMSFNKALKDLSNLIAGKESTDASRMLVNQVDKFLPMSSLGKDAAAMTDDIQRRIDTVGDLIKARYGHSGDLFPRRHELYGNVEVKSERDMFGHTITQSKLNDPVIREILRVNAGPGRFAKDMSFSGLHIKLTPQQEDKAQEVLSHMGLQQELLSVIQSPGYQELSGSPDTQAKLLKRTISVFRTIAYKKAGVEDPGIIDDAVMQAQRLKSDILGYTTSKSATERTSSLLRLVKEHPHLIGVE